MSAKAKNEPAPEQAVPEPVAPVVPAGDVSEGDTDTPVETPAEPLDEAAEETPAEPTEEASTEAVPEPVAPVPPVDPEPKPELEVPQFERGVARDYIPEGEKAYVQPTQVFRDYIPDGSMYPKCPFCDYVATKTGEAGERQVKAHQVKMHK